MKQLDMFKQRKSWGGQPDMIGWDEKQLDTLSQYEYMMNMPPFWKRCGMLPPDDKRYRK